MNYLTTILRSSKLLQNIFDKFGRVSSVSLLSLEPAANQTPQQHQTSSRPEEFRNLEIELLGQSLTSTVRLLLEKMETDLVKQIHTNHETLLNKLKSIESTVKQQQALATIGAGSNGVTNSAVSNAEIEAERKRLNSENEQLRNEVFRLVKELTQLEIRVKGQNNVASLDLLKTRSPTTVSSTPATSAPETKVEAKPSEPNVEVTQSQKPQQPEKGGKNKKQQAKQGESGKPAKPKNEPKPVEPERPIDAGRLDLRVGRIVDVEKHPDADSLYVERIDCGEEKPRTVVSGLVRFVPIEQMQNRLVVLLCNLKPAKMRGVLSEAMVMCASTPEKVEILSPPESSVPGDRVTFAKHPGPSDSQLNPKKKIWEQIAPDLATNDSLIACYKGDPFVVEGKGEVLAQTLKNVIVK